MLETIRFLLSGVCHQLPAHSYWVGGEPLPLCARCSGTFMGIWAGILTLRVMGRHRRAGLPSGVAAWALGALAAFWALDGINSAAAMALGSTLYAPTNLLRLVSGAAMGVTLSALVAPMHTLAFDVPTDSAPVVAAGRDVPALLAAAGAVVGAVHFGGWLPHVVWEIVLGAAVLGAITLLNAMLVKLIATRLHVWGAWPIGALFAFGELAAIATLRTILAI